MGRRMARLDTLDVGTRPRMTAPATDLRDLTEKEWQAQVKQLASQTGWKGAYHTYDSRRSQSGFPDLVLVRERVLFVELKRETGKLSPAQAEWIRWLIDAGAEAYVARPRDLEMVAAVLTKRSGIGLFAVQALLAEQTAAELPAQ